MEFVSDNGRRDYKSVDIAMFLVKTPPKNKRIGENVGLRSIKKLQNSHNKINSPPKESSITETKGHIHVKVGVLLIHDGVLTKNNTNTPQKC